MSALLKAILAGLAMHLASTCLAQAASCPDSAPSVMVLIDKTSPFGKEEQGVLLDILNALINDGPKPFELTLAELTGEVRTSRHSAPICVPGCKPDAASCSPPGDREMAQFKTALPPLIREYAGLLEENGKHSEIAEMVEDMLAGNSGDEAVHLILISDLLQNSAVAKGFEPEHFGALRAYLSATVARLGNSLHGGSVYVRGYGYRHGVDKQRLSTELDAALRAAWTDFFRAIGANEVDFGYSSSILP